ncbi:nucleoside diphosphate kinase [Maledivibacter halophilus]|uniref:nucleoside-diphosphate kinase n=1 Tax=Maledivibacter halophilus TaxID=36842 RepID=A0A1T5M9M5_9FIRM|nr:nucleoside diphosphate kinase [Maledivibacter halophilus]
MEKTLVLIKPDAIAKNIIGKIISIYEENALSIEELKMISATQEILNKHYAEHKNKPFFNELISSMEGKNSCINY